MSYNICIICVFEKNDYTIRFCSYLKYAFIFAAVNFVAHAVKNNVKNNCNVKVTLQFCRLFSLIINRYFQRKYLFAFKKVDSLHSLCFELKIFHNNTLSNLL